MKKKPSMPSNKKFGYMLLLSYVFLTTISSFKVVNIIYLYMNILIITILFFIVVFKSDYLSRLNYCWYILGNFLNKIISPFIMLIIFLIIVIPISIINKLFGRDILILSRSDKNTYWINHDSRNDIAVNFDNEF